MLYTLSYNAVSVGPHQLAVAGCRHWSVVLTWFSVDSSSPNYCWKMEDVAKRQKNSEQQQQQASGTDEQVGKQDTKAVKTTNKRNVKAGSRLWNQDKRPLYGRAVRSPSIYSIINSHTNQCKHLALNVYYFSSLNAGKSGIFLHCEQTEDLLV